MMLIVFLPLQEFFFNHGYHAVQRQRHDDQHKYTHIHQRHVITHAAARDQIAQAVVRPDQFAHHRADHRKRRADPQAAQEDGQCRRDLDFQ